MSGILTIFFFLGGGGEGGTGEGIFSRIDNLENWVTSKRHHNGYMALFLKLK